LNRKLIALNLVLLAVIVYAGMQFRNYYSQTKAKEAGVLNQPVKPVPAPPVTKPSPAPPVLASNYEKVAQKLLLDRSRNPEVPVEPPPKPPPPPPMPPLPIYHGMMNFADDEGVIAIMSVAAGKPHKAIHPGETIGEFKLLAVDRDGIDLEWRDQKVHKKLEELLDRTHSAVPSQTEKYETGYQSPVPVRPEPPPPAQYGPPAEDQGGGIRRCATNDTTPAGTVVNGLRKVTRPGPFGQICYWEPIGGGRQ